MNSEYLPWCRNQFVLLKTPYHQQKLLKSCYQKFILGRSFIYIKNKIGSIMLPWDIIMTCDEFVMNVMYDICDEYDIYTCIM